MPKYFVENYSPAEHFVTAEGGETQKLKPMSSVTAELSEEHARQLRNSGLRVTYQRPHKADDAPAEVDEPAAAPEPAKPAPKAGK